MTRSGRLVRPCHEPVNRWLATMGPVRPIRHGMEHMIFWKPAKTGYPDGCLVRKRPLTMTREKTEGRRSRDGWFGTWALHLQERRSFLLGKD